MYIDRRALKAHLSLSSRRVALTACASHCTCDHHRRSSRVASFEGHMRVSSNLAPVPMRETRSRPSTQFICRDCGDDIAALQEWAASVSRWNVIVVNDTIPYHTCIRACPSPLTVVSRINIGPGVHGATDGGIRGKVSTAPGSIDQLCLP